MSYQRIAINDARQLSLGGLIQAFERLPLTYESQGKPCPKRVSFDFGQTYPVRLTSYRGSYSELAITFGSQGLDDRGCYSESRLPMEATAFLAQLREADSIEFYGYKGGNYHMDADTPLWVAQWGESGYTAVVGVRDLGAEIVIDTAWCEF